MTVFWEWSLEAYERPGVAPALLRLQDEFGFSAPICLWLMWCAREFDAMPESLVRLAVEQGGAWSDPVTKPLRAARRAIRACLDDDRQGGSGDRLRALYDEAKSVELHAERVECEILERVALRHLRGDGGGRADKAAAASARANLSAYASLIGAPRRAGFSTDPLQRMVAALFEETGQGPEGDDE